MIRSMIALEQSERPTCKQVLDDLDSVNVKVDQRISRSISNEEPPFPPEVIFDNTDWTIVEGDTTYNPISGKTLMTSLAILILSIPIPELTLSILLLLALLFVFRLLTARRRIR